MEEITWFRKAFADLTEHAPFPWQERMFNSFLRGTMPRRCEIPTGLGKTSVIHIWLLALSRILSKSDAQFPHFLRV